MAEKLEPKETLSLEELLISNIDQQVVIVNLLHEKGILNKAEKEIRIRLKLPFN